MTLHAQDVVLDAVERDGSAIQKRGIIFRIANTKDEAVVRSTGCDDDVRD
jgi:hypothetical protein